MEYGVQAKGPALGPRRSFSTIMTDEMKNRIRHRIKTDNKNSKSYTHKNYLK